MAYSKGAFAESLGLSRGELEAKAKEAGFSTTEAFYDATGGTGRMLQAPTIEDIDAYAESIGLPQAREYTQGFVRAGIGLEQQLQDLPEQVAGEVRGFDVNATQRARIEGQQRQELSGQLADVGRQGARAATYEAGLAQDVSDRWARQITLYSLEKQDQLSRYLAKFEAGAEMDLAEFNAMADLAMQEDEYDREKDLYAYKAEIDDKYKTTDTNWAGNLEEDAQNFNPYQDDSKGYRQGDWIWSGTQWYYSPQTDYSSLNYTGPQPKPPGSPD
jgi:hypothetical protein